MADEKDPVVPVVPVVPEDAVPDDEDAMLDDAAPEDAVPPDELSDDAVSPEEDAAFDDVTEATFDEPETGAEPAFETEEVSAVATAAPGPRVAPARFPPILEEGPGEAIGSRNLDLLMDVSVPITAEIGRTDMPLAEVLRLGPGSVIELDKSADEPVDVLVNGKLLATAEVVVVGDRFGVRILDVVDRPE